MYDLYRFMKKEHAEQFLQGNLHLSSLGHFWPQYPKERDESGEPQGRLDPFEGTVSAQRPEQCPLPDVFRNALKGDFCKILVANQYVNLLCMVQHFCNLNNRTITRIDPKMRNWGDFAVRIRNVDVFLERLENYAKRQGDDYFLAGPVEYLNRLSDVSRTDCFYKYSNHSCEHEWRVAYLTDIEGKKMLAENWSFDMGPYDEPLQISLGSLDDIAEIIPSAIIFNDLERVYEGFKVVENNEFTPMPEPEPNEYAFPALHDRMYFGWGDRGAFQDLVASLDGGKVTARFAL